MTPAASGTPAGDGDDSGSPPVAGEIVARRHPIDPRAVIGEAWNLFKNAWPTCIICYWGAVAACWLIINLLVIVLASLNVAIGDPSFTPVLEFAEFLGLALVPAWLWLGQGIPFLKIARREPAILADLFAAGPYLLTAILATLLFLGLAALPCLIVYGIIEALLVGAGGESLVATVRGLLPARTPRTVAEVESVLIVLLGLPAVAVGVALASFFAVRVRLRTFPLLILDRGAGVFESIRLAIRLSRGRVAPLVVIHLAQFTINFAGWLLCCAGLFVTLPLTGLISAVTYNQMATDLPPIEAPADEDDE